MPRIRGYIRHRKDQGLQCQWRLPSWHACVCLWLKMPQSPRENPFDSSSHDQSTAMAWLPHPSPETVSVTIRIPHYSCFLRSMFLCGLFDRLCTCPKVIPSSLFPLLLSRRYLASLRPAQLCKDGKGTVSHQCLTLADKSLPLLT